MVVVAVEIPSLLAQHRNETRGNMKAYVALITTRGVFKEMPTMNGRSAQRLAKLQEALASGGTLHLRDAAELCDVSEMTIRRDLTTSPQG